MFNGDNKEGKLWGGVLTGLYVAIFGALLLWGSISVEANDEDKPQMGMIVDFGSNEEVDMGPEEPKIAENIPPKAPEPTPKSEPVPTPPVATQPIEPAPEVTESIPETEEQPTMEERPIVEEQPVEEEVQQEKKPEVNTRALFRSNSELSESTLQGKVENSEGNPGSKDGTRSDNTNGVSGEGNVERPEWELVGRSLRGTMPKPSYENSEASGKIVVNITVDHQGNVIFAELGSGSTSFDSHLVNEALKAARKAKFSPSDKDIQRGTITYNFVRKVR
jgi:TonB family protein